MSDLRQFIERMPAIQLGETLRAITFVGKGVGCCDNFEVREDAELWSKEERLAFIRRHYKNPEHREFLTGIGEGYTYPQGSLEVDVFWYWDGVGTLLFLVRDGDRIIRAVDNTDCKNESAWEDLEPEEIAAISRPSAVKDDRDEDGDDDDDADNLSLDEVPSDEVLVHLFPTVDDDEETLRVRPYDRPTSFFKDRPASPTQPETQESAAEPPCQCAYHTRKADPPYLKDLTSLDIE